MIDTRDSRLYRMGYGAFVFWSQRHIEEGLFVATYGFLIKGGTIVDGTLVA